jgi:hypothetical protein
MAEFRIGGDVIKVVNYTEHVNAVLGRAWARDGLAVNVLGSESGCMAHMLAEVVVTTFCQVRSLAQFEIHL